MAYLDLTHSSPARPPLADRTREKAQPTKVSPNMLAAVSSRRPFTNTKDMLPFQQACNLLKLANCVSRRLSPPPPPSRRAAPPPAESNSRRRARLIAHYRARIEEIERAKERYSDEIDEKLERRPIGVWDGKWYSREAQVEVEEEAAIELARMERKRKEYLRLLIEVQIEEARLNRRRQHRDRHKLECITID